ncbi:MAG: NlpC/P60 family protein [Acidobacteriota bacterium]
MTLFTLWVTGLSAAHVAVKSPAPKKSSAKPSTRKASAKRITPKTKAAPRKTTAKKIAPKRIAPSRRSVSSKHATSTKKAAPKKIAANKVAPKRIAPKRGSTTGRRRSVKATPVKFVAGERILEPISCASKQTAPDTVALCTDCPDHALSEAYALIGLKYKRGGTSQETGMDCSGFTQHVYRQSCNVALPRSASQQFEVGQPTEKEDLLRGDLVFFRSRRGWHVGIYTGDGQFIHSPNRRSAVKISSLSAAYYRKTYLGARRLTQNLIEPISVQPPALSEPLPDSPALTDADADAAGDEAADDDEAAEAAGETPAGNGVN